MTAHYIKQSIIFIVFLVSILNVCNADGLEIINLNHRPASEIIPIIRPLLDKTGSLSGEKYVLFINTSDKNLRQLKSTISMLDADLRQLNISIMQESEATMKRYGFKISGELPQKANANVYSNQRTANNLQQIRVTEGQWASIQTGISVPSISRVRNTNGTVTEFIRYQTIVTRLKIRPQIIGNKVDLKIESSIADRTTSKTQRLHTTVEGKLGEWIALGGIQSAVDNSNSGFVFSTQHNANSMRQIFIKINITKYQD